MKRAGVPILPGSEGILASDGEAMEWARQVGSDLLPDYALQLYTQKQ